MKLMKAALMRLLVCVDVHVENVMDGSIWLTGEEWDAAFRGSYEKMFEGL